MKHFVTAAAVALALAAGVARLAAAPSQEPRPSGQQPEGLGRVLDREGLATVRRLDPGSRPQPLEPGLHLEPGDWIEVGTRGANAGKLRLSSGVELTAGPGTLVELLAPDRVTLHRGDLACRPPAGVEFTVSDAAPSGRTAIELDARAVLRAGESGLERLDADPRWLAGYESDASTEALGSLLAKVDGRDVPLTIGYHKVTVDVRDQLARTVVEQSFVNHTDTILEGVFYFPLPADASISGFGMWIGGELVQGDIVEKQRAREIYETILRERRDPGLLEWTGGNIFKARVFPIEAEKRVLISYTQVLPRERNGYRYRYGLQSELLRKNPLSRLQLEVNVHSARALAAVTSPSHGGRTQLGEHSARFEFSAEEYTPESDFELRVELAPGAERLTLAPHRRGDDGYFMLLVDAPELPAAEQAALDEPLDLLILADTSGSMWGPQREVQLAFVEALLAALAPGDRFDLATCDVETRWAFGGPVDGAARGFRERALAFLEAREPLGWSDLEGACAEAFARVGADTQVVYVGDAVPTSGAADPVALARALEARYPGRGTFHAVVPGSSSEPAVLRALASLGGGSLRTIGAGGGDALQTAHALLDELIAPALEDLALDFGGLPVAAVYPERLPNLPAGGQHVVVGRFDAARGEVSGSVVLSGSVEGRAFRQELAVTIPAGDEGNSFVPRLWARRHLDHLLDQGASPEIVERIAALSADYQIVTPYTSFLVLESDADRERFGVQKGFRMRDGEEFFLEGREAGRHELVSAQMQAASGWRRRLQAEARARLAGMGRDLTALLGAGEIPIDLLREAAYLEFGDKDAKLGLQRGAYRGPGDSVPPSDGLELGFEDLAASSADENELSGEPAEQELAESDDFLADDARQEAAHKSVAASPSLWGGVAERVEGRGAGLHRRDRGLFGGHQRPAAVWSALFPYLDANPPAPPPANDWPADVRALIEPLDRRAALVSGVSGFAGWRVAVLRSGAPDGRTSAEELLVAPAGWWSSGPRLGTHAFQVQWLDGGRRGVLAEGWRLGRERAAAAGDALGFSGPLRWYLQDHGLATYAARREDAGPGRARVTFWAPTQPRNEFVVELDLERGVVLEDAWRAEGRSTQRTVYGEFREIGGLWWPASARFEVEGAEPTLMQVTVEALDEAVASELLAVERARRADALLLGADVPLVEAKQALADNKGGLDARFTVLAHELLTQRWQRAFEQLAALEASAGAYPGFERVRLFVLQQGRRNEELRLRALEVARDLVERPRAGELGLCTDLIGMSSAFGAHEQLALLRTLLAVVERGAADPEARKHWDRNFLSALQRTGRAGEHLAAARGAAERHPADPHFQRSYAEALAASGDLDAAVAWLESAETRADFSEYDRRNLRQGLLDLLWNGYRLEDLVRRFEAWSAADPAGLDEGACGRYLAALVFLDRVDEAFARADAWSAPAARAERETHEDVRLRAVVQFLLGQASHLNSGLVEDVQAERLAALARALAAHRDADYLLGSILQNWRFRQTDQGRAVLAELYARLDRELFELPAEHVQVLVGWLHSWNEDVADAAAWQALGARLFQRWRASADEQERLYLANAIAQVAGPELLRDFRRADLAAAERDGERQLRAQVLWNELVAGAWSAAVEAELFGLLAVLDASAERDEQRDALALRLVELVDWVLARRTDQLTRALPDYERLTRRQLAAAQKAARARTGAELSASLGSREAGFEPAFLREWIALERLWLDAVDGRSGDEAGHRALALATAREAGLLERERSVDRERVLATRGLMTSAHLLTKRADAGLEAELRAVLGRLGDAGVELPDGRGLLRDLLVSLDRTEDLDALLAAWFGDGRRYAGLRFGIDRALILAERGELQPAAELLERIEAFDELPPELLLLLSDWHTALDQREPARAARIRAFAAQGEDALAQSLQGRLNRYQRSGDGVPEELDPDVPLQLIALFAKAAEPARHLWTLRAYYEATKDFRLLECLPNALVGHSAQGVYAFLAQVQSLTEIIDEEAVVDRVLAGLEQRAGAELTDTDRRALALLRFQVVLRAARQTHGTARHAERSLTALSSAFPGELAEGEALLLAEFLVQQGRLAPAALAEEQLRQLRALAGAGRDPDERLTTAGHFARGLWNHERRDEALRVYEAALGERRELDGGALPESAHGALRELSEWLVSLQSFARAEALWEAEIASARTEHQRREYQLDRLRVLCALWTRRPERENYVRARDELLAQLEPRTSEAHARQVIELLCDVWNVAHRRPVQDEAGEDAHAFAFGRLPAVLGRYQYREGQQVVQRIAQTLEVLRGAETALAFLVARAEGEPAWLRFQGQDFWGQHGWRFAHFLARAGSLPADLEGRALALVVRELRRDLSSRSARNRSAYDQRHADFWSAQRGTFLATALEIAAEQRTSPHTVLHVAAYLFEGLNARDQALDALAALHARGELDLEGRGAYARYLQQDRRWAASLPVVLGLTRDAPLDIGGWAMLMRAHFHLEHAGELRASLAQAEATLREAGAWSEHGIEVLATTAGECGLFTESVRLLEEAIALHVRSYPNRGVGDGTLSRYYMASSRALAGLGRTWDAVEAAAGAILAWGPDIHQRREALDHVERVLIAAPDLADYLERFEAQVEASGLENPILRKAVAAALTARGDHAGAAAQLEQALAQQPNDLEAHAALVAAYRALGRDDLLADSLLARARAGGHDLALYTELGDHLRASDPADAERAYTNLVELSAHESEGHAALASVREREGAFAAALLHWEHVIRIRTKEPTGYLGRARALIALGRLDEARQALDHLRGQPWPEHFGNVRQQADELERSLPRQG